MTVTRRPRRAAAALALASAPPLLGAARRLRRSRRAGAADATELPFEQAVAQATDVLPRRSRIGLAMPRPKLAKRGVVLDPMLDTITGQQTETTMLLETPRHAAASSNLDPQFEFLPFQSGEPDARRSYLLTGTMTRVPTAPTTGRTVRLSLALTDLKTGTVVAQASALAKDEGLDHTPSRYYRDSPVLVKDKVDRGLCQARRRRRSASAPTPYYIERIAAATRDQRSDHALQRREVPGRARPVPQRAVDAAAASSCACQSGIYLTNMKLGRTAEAEQAFGRIVALGIAYNELGVKFLFNPGSTEFWSDPKVSGAYGMWLRQIAREAIEHQESAWRSSATPARAAPGRSTMRSRCSAPTTSASGSRSRRPTLAARTRAEGMGFRQNIVGSGTDNAVDALDRRVEFKIIPCG